MEHPNESTFRLILNIQKGLGFNFLKQPIVISCSLVDHTLETDPIQSCHNPVFESKLIWETEKETFNKLCQRNIPIKVEVNSGKAAGRKQQVGYILLSLLSAKTCVNQNGNYSWHKLLGVKFEGKSSNPQLYLSLFTDDCANILECPMISDVRCDEKKNIPMTQNSDQKQTSKAIVPRICLSSKMIEIGIGDDCQDIFEIELNIAKHDYLNIISPRSSEKIGNMFFTLLIFSQVLKIESKRESQSFITIVIKTNLSTLSLYFKNSPYAVIKLSSDNEDIGVCCFDIRQMLPTDELSNFLENFCNDSKAYTYKEKCFLISSKTGDIPEDSKGRKPYIDLEVTLKYVNNLKNMNPDNMENPIIDNNYVKEAYKEKLEAEQNKIQSQLSKKFSDNSFEVDSGLISIPPSSSEHKIEGSISLDSNIEAIMKKINLLAPSSHQMFDNLTIDNNGSVQNGVSKNKLESLSTYRVGESNVNCRKSDLNAKNVVKKMSITKRTDYTDDTTNRRDNLSPRTIENNIMQVVNELEDWKECQQELFKSELKEKEEKYLNSLINEWDTCRVQYENKILGKVEQSQILLSSLKEIVENLKLREIQLSERERKLCSARDEFELHYRNKYLELKDAAKQMEIDYQHQLKLHKLEYSKLEMETLYLKQENSSLMEKLKFTNSDRNS
ncbi:uncharacterized protein LOC143920433 [Arctopsyche grandis]|uniref:uncharacterized protein LOC143920433 n=1 Tax=Arctopsyche grandis TaxID=121162 RepID=UPI00406D6D0A